MTRGRLVRLVVGLLALTVLALLLSQAGRLPGPAGDAVRRNAEADLDAAALFYTEVDGWRAWGAGAPARRGPDPHAAPARTGGRAAAAPTDARAERAPRVTP